MTIISVDDFWSTVVKDIYIVNYCALRSLYSLGAINLENKKVMTEITMHVGKFDVSPDKMYVNFFDVPRENICYNRPTFGG